MERGEGAQVGGGYCFAAAADKGALSGEGARDEDVGMMMTMMNVTNFMAG